MEKAKAILITAIVLFAVGAAMFLISLFANIGDSRTILAYIGGAFVILAIVAVYIGTIVRVKEREKK